MKSLVILPSYNERDNIENLIHSIAKLECCDICIVDDNSPDGTGNFVETIRQSGKFKSILIHLIIREAKLGRGSAVREGLEWGLSQDYQHFIEMDCDFSHDPNDIPKGLSFLDSYDVAIGSRYAGGKITDWPLKRHVLSFFSNVLARTLIESSVRDYTNGFRFYNRKSANLICTNHQRNTGHIYLSEVLALLLKNGLSIKEFPITFVNRKRGNSNINFKEIYSSLKGIFEIAKNYKR